MSRQVGPPRHPAPKPECTVCQKAVGRTLYVRNGGLCTPCKREFGTGPLDNAVTYPKYGVQLALDTGLPVSAQQSLDEM